MSLSVVPIYCALPPMEVGSLNNNKKRILLHQIHQKTLLAQQMPSSCRWIYSPGTRPEMLWPNETHKCLCTLPDINFGFGTRYYTFWNPWLPATVGSFCSHDWNQEELWGPKVHMALGFAVSAIGHTEVWGLPLITLVLKGSISKERNKMHFWRRQMQHYTCDLCVCVYMCMCESSLV